MKKAKKVLTLVACAVLLVCLSVGATLAYLTATTEKVNNTFSVGNITFGDNEDLSNGLTEAKTDLYGEPVDEDGDRIVEKVDGDVTDYLTDEEYINGLPTWPTEVPRVQGNEYKLLPGHTYLKDPTVIIGANSEECYVRMIVTITDLKDLKAVMSKAKPESVTADGTFLPEHLVGGWDPKVWECVNITPNGDDAATYEFWYTETVTTLGTTPTNGEAKKLPALFTTIVIPDGIDNDGLTVEYEKDENGDAIVKDNGNVVDLADLADVEINIIAHAIQTDGFEDAEEAWGTWEYAGPVPGAE